MVYLLIYMQKLLDIFRKNFVGKEKDFPNDYFLAYLLLEN